MADLRVSGGQPPAVQPAQRTEAVRAAQRAFFQAALNAAAPTAAARPVEAQPTIQSVSRVVTPSTTSPAAEPARYLRPGSLLDIKV
jgi:hypothetical protein